MLRDTYAHGSKELQAILKAFAVGQAVLIDVKLYRMLTPDSFIWKLRMSNGIYYLYAEDYIENEAHVQKQINTITDGQKGHFIAPTAGIGEAVLSGSDEVFLYKIDELNDQDRQEL